MKHPCYTTKTGIKIGYAYQPPLPELTFDEELIQAALLSKGRTLSPLAVGLACLFVCVCILWVTK